MTRASIRRRTARALSLLTGTALLMVSLVAAGRARHLHQHIGSAQLGLAQLNATFSGGAMSAERLLREPNQLSALRATVLALRDDLASIEELARPALRLSEHLSWVPGIGQEIAAAPPLLELAGQTCEMALSLLDGITPLAKRLAEEGQGLRILGPEALDSILTGELQISSARMALARARSARQKIDTDSLAPRLSEPVARFDTLAPAMETALDSLDLLPALLGARQPKAYLVLAQNSDELRATGGFISGVGLLHVSHGQITSVSFQDSYTVDNLERPHPDAPAPLRQHMAAGMLVLRDANWWPDFRTSAGVVGALYAQDTGQSVDGVIAVNEKTLELLIEAMGSVEVPGYPEAVSTSNLQEMLRKYWESPLQIAPGGSAEWWSHRKDFAGDLLAALLQEADQLGTEELIALAMSLRSALHQRSVQIYVWDPAASDLLHELGWDGSVRGSPGDFLMVVDSNVGFNKVNPNIRQAIDYEVTVDRSGQATSLLTLSYRHLVERPTPACIHEPRYGDSYADLMQRCYWDHLRIYIPAGSQVIDIIGSDTQPEIYEESGCTVVAVSFLLETGQARAIQIRYAHLLAIGSGHYSLLVQKQAGSQDHPLRVQVQMGEGATAASYVPIPAGRDGSRVTWHTTLSQDFSIELRWN